MCILNQTDKMIMLGSDNGIVQTFDMQTHELVDVWVIDRKVTALACYPVAENKFMTAMGTDQGNLNIRSNWEASPERIHNCGSAQINDIKFSRNTKYLAIASNDCNVYLLKAKESNYEPSSAYPF